VIVRLVPLARELIGKKPDIAEEFAVEATIEVRFRARGASRPSLSLVRGNEAQAGT
jgi:hypothetical protein